MVVDVVVDVVVRYWLEVMMEDAEERVKRGQEVRHHNSLFYMDYGMVASSDPRWLQGSFSTLVGLFDRVGLRNNVGKTVGMVCRPFRAAGTQLEAAYRQRITVEVTYYRERQKGWVQCRECGEEMSDGYMAGQIKTQHRRASEHRWIWTTSSTGEEPRTYPMAFPAKGGPRGCPVERCLGRAAARTAMRIHFLHQHVRDAVVILEEVNLPQPR